MKKVLLCLAVPLGAVGCSASTAFTETFDAEGITRVESVAFDGNVMIQGENGLEKLTIHGSNTGEGFTQAHAANRVSEFDYAVYEEDGTVFASAAGVDADMEVDLSAFVPHVLDVVAYGEYVDVANVHGEHDLFGTTMTATGLSGSARLESHHGEHLRAEIQPDANGFVEIVSECTPVKLGLPVGLDYDLHVHGGFLQRMKVDDLGFDTLEREGRHIRARTGEGTVRIDVVVTGAGVEIYALD